jgi:translation initiation factor IF-2
MPMPDKKEEEKKEVLDLIGAKPKRTRKVQPASPAPEEKPVAKKTTATKSPEKKQALDLLSSKKKTKAKPVEQQEKKPVAQKETPSAAPEEKPAVAEKTPTATVEAGGVINLKTPVTVADLATAMGQKSFRIIKNLIPMGIFANPGTLLEADTVSALCADFGFVFEREKREKGSGVKPQPETPKEPDPVPVVDEPKEVLKVRTPIITVMGHVDHGKTTLLDHIRNSRVAQGEAGGITQHIGAYTVEHEGKTLTFIDTPGHAIFTEMRARGADVTDIVVLVVAANDGIMPQTREAINHAKNAKKPIIVAINKCDLPAADPMRTMAQLMEEGLVPSSLGGDIDCVELSALTGTGVNDLLDLLVLQAEVLELKANPKANCRASIIEARVEPGRGCSATAIVQSGTIKTGMSFICGPYAGKVRNMSNDKGQKVKAAGPGMPVEIVGFSETPNVGDELVEMESDRAAKKLAEERQLELRQARLTAPRKSRLEDVMAMMGEGNQKPKLNIFLKADVQGSVEAIRNAIMDIQSDKVECNLISATAGPISESDVLLASSSDAIILGFNVKVEANAVKTVKREGVQVKLYSIVYELIDQVRDAMLGLLKPETREKLRGHAEVLQIFKVPKGRAAGCRVKDGVILRNCEARVLRDGQPVFDGKMSTLRRFEDDVNEVSSGFECGIRLGDFNEYEVGDIIECYELEQVKQTL